MTPISADPYLYYRNVVPYTENFMLSVQRQITSNALLTVSYVGNEGIILVSCQRTRAIRRCV